MKNRYARGTHISKVKFRKLLRMFCEDLTILQIAKLTNLNRNTVTRIRMRILTVCENSSWRSLLGFEPCFCPACAEVLSLRDQSLINE
jgi:hypothetical protein